ncbi:hypothetical protein BC829DRAFT_407862 [Chytridium lagenaria]|nr:hypothetical protein BC829DRAFT_407862 [Chytridium lagenaria]
MPSSTLLFLALILLACIHIRVADARLPPQDKDHSNYGDYHRAAKENGGNSADAVPPGEGDDMYVFFSMYDYNHDAHLDGHELRVAFTEFEEKVDEARNGPDSTGKYAKDRVTLEEVEGLVDHVLDEDDLDNDGMISWEEYLMSQKAHHQS